MVRTWNSDPSRDLNKNERSHFGPNTQIQLKFGNVKRFVEDGQTRIPNFLNDDVVLSEGADVLYDARAVPRLADVVENRKVSPLKSQGNKFAPIKTYMSNDPRFSHLHEPYAKPIGPGEYVGAEDNSQIGQLRRDSPLRSSLPGKDPSRPSPAFASPPRQPLFEEQFHRSPDRIYIEPSLDYQKHSHSGSAPFPAGGKNVDVATWRNGGRLVDGWQSLPDIRYDSRVDRSGKLNTIHASASDSGSANSWLQSKQARLIAIPKERTPDSRLSRSVTYEQLYDMSPKLGPGSYSPMTSEGQKKKSYRMFASDSPPPSPSIKARTPRSPRDEADHNAPSSSFSTTDRAKKYGPFDRYVDSQLVK